MGIVFVAAQGALGLFVWQYRDRAGAKKVEYSHGNTKLEVLWTVLTAVLFVGLNLMGSNVWAQSASPRLSEIDSGGSYRHAVRLVFPVHRTRRKVRRHQSQADGSFRGQRSRGRTRYLRPAAKDDVVTGIMYLPVNRQVDLTLRAVDVIHSFFVPNMRFKQDAVPGLEIHMHFTPTQIGDYEIACAELCGLGHYKMHGMLKVVSQEDFDKWLAAREAEKQ